MSSNNFQEDDTGYLQQQSGVSRNPPLPMESVKETRHLSQLSRADSELVRVLYREATIQGWRKDLIPRFIYSKSKIRIAYSLIHTLENIQKADNRHWYYEMAKDSLTYISQFRKSHDKLDMLSHQLWKVITNPKINWDIRISAMKEDHSVTKTQNLLLRDLPFIANLSEMYEMTASDTEKRDRLKKQLDKQKDVFNNDMHNQDGHITKSDYDGANASLVKNILENLKGNKRIDSVLNTKKSKQQQQHQPVDADVMESMKEELTKYGYESDPVALAAISKEEEAAEQRFLEENLKKLDKELGEVSSEDQAKLVKISQDYRKRMSYLDQILEPYKDAIDRIKEISGDKTNDNNK
jgi:hypothetical protein